MEKLQQQEKENKVIKERLDKIEKAEKKSIERLLKEISMANDLRIIFWNANGILKKKTNSSCSLTIKKLSYC
jgi:hypothetical protein